MGRKRHRRALDVYIGASRVGQLTRSPSGVISFRYDSSWLTSDLAFPISLSMPLSDRVSSGEATTGYFDGLLPDDQSARETIAVRQRAESAGAFDLLAAIGRDCVGALRFLPEDSDPPDPAQMKYRSVDEVEIASRLASLRRNPLGLNLVEDDFRISLAGVQEKTAFLWIDNQWQLPLGPTPTSHIFKPAIAESLTGADFSDTPWNEFLCLKLCEAFGLEVAHADVQRFGGNPVIVVERFDRVWYDGVLYRLPQEDLCQALGISPMRKYQSDGGPGIADIMKFLDGAIAPFEDRLTFMKTQVIFWLLAAIDGHAKNFSIFITPGGYRLTPLYDVMSSSPYPQFPIQKTKLAMAIGAKGYYRLNQIQLRHFFQTAQKVGLREQNMERIFSDVAAGLDHAISKTATIATEVGVPESTSGPIFDGMRSRARVIQSGQ